MEENKKKNSGLIVLVILLILCVIGLAGYIVYDKVFENTKVINNTTTTTITTTTDNKKINEDTEYLLNNFINLHIGFCSSYRNYNFGSKNEVSYDDLTKKELQMILAAYMTNINEKIRSLWDSSYESSVIVSKTEMIDAFKSIFGDNTIELDDAFDTSMIDFKRLDVNSYEVSRKPGFGCTDGSSYYNLIESKYNDDKLEFHVAYVTIVNDVYCDENSKCEDVSKVYNDDKEICDYKDLKSNISDLPQYKFVFVKKNNNYVFEKIIKMN